MINGYRFNSKWVDFWPSCKMAAKGDSKVDMAQVRYNLAQFRKDRRDSTPENVFRISTMLPNGMSYAEFALFYVLRNKKTGVTTTTRKTRTKRDKGAGNVSSDSGSPPLPLTRGQARGMGRGLGDDCKMEKIDKDLLSKRFRDVIGEPLEGIASFTVSKRRKKK